MERWMRGGDFETRRWGDWKGSTSLKLRRLKGEG